MKCPECKSENPDESKFCNECGTQITGSDCFVSAKFGPLMIFLKRWLAIHRPEEGCCPGIDEVEYARERLGALKQ